MTEKKVTFGRVFWPSLVAILVATILGLVLFFVILGGIIGGLTPESKPVSIEENTVLHMKLDGPISEKTSSTLDPMSLQMNYVLGLSDILYGIESAKKDKKIKGIFLDLQNVSCGVSTAREIRKAINDFEESGKFVVAYNSGEAISLKKYYISSAANEVYGFPSSNMEFMGLGSELTFFKNSLAKLDIEMQVIRGKNNDFKSAVEPFFLDKMSDSSRLQTERFMNGIWEDIRMDIAADRKLSAERLNQIAEELLIRDAEDAVKFKLMDGTKYRDEVLEIIMKKLGVKKADDMHLQAFEKYAKKKFEGDQIMMQDDEANIAVILASGDVSTNGDGLSSKEICKLFQEVRKNKTIKTVVFRINSPGGSALASDEIWREVKLTNKTKKVIVSMGDVAASGGYYIAAPASYIFAEPTTITGSIGVFGVIPYTGKFMENTLGFSFDRVSTNKHAVLSTNRKLTEEELSIIQTEVDQIYEDFLLRVAEGRGMTTQQVNVLARGRVWTGKDAKARGLVDELGGIEDAINYAAKQAKIKNKKILYYPLKKEDKLEQLIEQFSEEDESMKIKANQGLPEEFIKHYEQLKKLELYQGMQMRMPFELELN